MSNKFLEAWLLVNVKSILLNETLGALWRTKSERAALPTSSWCTACRVANAGPLDRKLQIIKYIT